ncbi:hypothetical protein [Peribacillus frigoritolerans]|uniref:hypothetical protein n=1 Tax=Peribacillus frigoritolerans TaxID=450367 RepID=UPI00227EB5A8|nr:hypothetical protein [Peribacillus frigoritolerans]MCY9007130.1 hypothetical protein [Peribacillus frigoritolerans]
MWWTDEKVIYEFKNYMNAGSEITDKGLRNNYPTLRFQIQKRFGGYRSFLNSQGIDYDDIKIYNTWTNEKIVKEFEKLQKGGQELHVSNLRQNHNRLLGAIEREYGTYKNFLNKMGFDYSLIRLYQNWDNQKIVDEFINYTNNNEDLRESSLHKNNSALYSQILKKFKSYRTFLSTLGHEYDDIRGYVNWTDQRIDEEFEKYLIECKDLKASTMFREHQTLYDAIKRRYVDYGKYLEFRGFDYNEVRGRVEWTNEKVEEEYLKLAKENDGILSFTGLSIKNNKLYQQIRKRYKNYKSFLISLRLTEDEIYKIIKFEQEIGISFEKLVKEMFERLGYEYEYQYRDIKGIRPDFYDRTNNELIDVKLSFYTGFKSYTPKKYLIHCKKLTLIYLRGETFEHNITNLTLVPIDSYYGLLEKRGLQDLIEEFNRLKKLLD